MIKSRISCINPLHYLYAVLWCNFLKFSILSLSRLPDSKSLLNFFGKEIILRISHCALLIENVFFAFAFG